MHVSFARFLPLALGFALIACDDEQPHDKLLISASSPLTLAVGDTSAEIQVSKTTFDALGKENTQSDYRYFTLTSSDTTVVAVVEVTRLVARGAGQATVTAADERSSLVSENKLSVTVNP